MNDSLCNSSSCDNPISPPEGLPSGTVFTASEQNGKKNEKNAKKEKKTDIGGQKEILISQFGQSSENKKGQSRKRKSQDVKGKGPKKSKTSQKTAWSGKKGASNRLAEQGLRKGLTQSRPGGPYIVPDSSKRKAAVIKRMRNSQDLDVRTTLFVLSSIIKALENKLEF